MESQVNNSLRSVQYYTIAQRWLEELNFFSREAKFLHHLFEDYFIAYFSSFFTAKLKDLEYGLTELETEEKKIVKMLDLQLLALDLMLNDKVKENTEYLEARQIELENWIKKFILAFQNIKKELYLVVETADSCHERFSTANP